MSSLLKVCSSDINMDTKQASTVQATWQKLELGYLFPSSGRDEDGDHGANEPRRAVRELAVRVLDLALQHGVELCSERHHELQVPPRNLSDTRDKVTEVKHKGNEL